MRNGGVKYVLKLFKESLSENAPTEKDKNMAKFIISNLPNTGNDKIPSMNVMLDYAYKWKDIEIWRELVRSCGGDMKVQGENGLFKRAASSALIKLAQGIYIYSFDVRFLLTSLIYLVLRSCCAIKNCPTGSPLSKLSVRLHLNLWMRMLFRNGARVRLRSP